MSIDIKVKSLQKATEVLECFIGEKPELGITEISEKVGLFKSTVHNIISTFESLGYVEKNPENNKYKLGLKILELSHALTANMNSYKIIQPYLQAVATKIKESVYFGIPYGEGVVLYIDFFSADDRTPQRNILGLTAPMYCTGQGKAMLPFLPDDMIQRIIAKGFEKFTENTITDGDRLLKELETIRQRGYSIDNMEHEYGIKCIGMPIMDRFGRLIGGVSASVPSLRFDEKFDFIRDVLKENIIAARAKL